MTWHAGTPWSCGFACQHKHCLQAALSVLHGMRLHGSTLGGMLCHACRSGAREERCQLWRGLLVQAAHIDDLQYFGTRFAGGLEQFRILWCSTLPEGAWDALGYLFEVIRSRAKSQTRHLTSLRHHTMHSKRADASWCLCLHLVSQPDAALCTSPN